MLYIFFLKTKEINIQCRKFRKYASTIRKKCPVSFPNKHNRLSFSQSFKAILRAAIPASELICHQKHKFNYVIIWSETHWWLTMALRRLITTLNFSSLYSCQTLGVSESALQKIIIITTTITMTQTWMLILIVLPSERWFKPESKEC